MRSVIFFFHFFLFFFVFFSFFAWIIRVETSMRRKLVPCTREHLIVRGSDYLFDCVWEKESFYPTTRKNVKARCAPILTEPDDSEILSKSECKIKTENIQWEFVEIVIVFRVFKKIHTVWDWKKIAKLSFLNGNLNYFYNINKL